MPLPLPAHDEPAREDTHDWKSDYQLWLPLMLVSWALAYMFQDPFITDWDGFDYAAYAVRNVPTALGLGRALFLAYNHVLWELAHRWFGLPPEHAYLVLRYGVIAQSGPAVVGIYALYKELTGHRLAALCGTLMVALSPFYIVYSGRGMSEVPAFLMFGWSLWWMVRSLRLGYLGRYIAAAALFGASANIREFAVFYLPLVPLAGRVYGVRWHRCLIAFGVAGLAAVAGPIFWALYEPQYYIPSVINWYRLSAKEREVHPVTVRNVWFVVAYAYACSPAATLLVPFTFQRLRSNQRLRTLLLFGGFGLLADLVLLANHDLSVNPRYLLTGLFGLAATSGWCLAEWIKKRSRWSILALVTLSILTAISLVGMRQYLRGQEPAARAARAYLSKVEGLPPHAVFIVGARTPLVNFYNSIGARPVWKTISPGSGWPDERLGAVIDGYLAEGRPVYVDFDESLWPQGMREHSREAAGLEMIKRNYQLELVRDSLYQVAGK